MINANIQKIKAYNAIATEKYHQITCRYCLKSQQVNGKECGQCATAIFVQIRNRIYVKSFTTQNS